MFFIIIKIKMGNCNYFSQSPKSKTIMMIRSKIKKSKLEKKNKTKTRDPTLIKKPLKLKRASQRRRSSSRRRRKMHVVRPTPEAEAFHSGK